MPLFMNHATMDINACHSKSPPASHHHFTSLVCRLGRIFTHAYFHHCEEFKRPEAESSLYARFLALTECFDLIPEPEPEPLVGKPESRSELQQLPSPSDPEPTPPSPTSEPPSPLSDDSAAAAALGPVVSPSSSTAPQTEGHAIQSMLEHDHEWHEGESKNASQAEFNANLIVPMPI
ncbi:hypothetical protein B0H14DRAFT_3434258 [Mycena olivaceomarginata]|nr:hypothetical protein B0H14DRAFT_3434258 [Mycena olivaceomarginata]